MERRTLILIITSIIVLTALATYLYFDFVKPGSPEIDLEVNLKPIEPEDLSAEEWLEDFEYLYEFVKDNYPYLSVKERTHGYNWLDLRDEFENRFRDVEDNGEFLGTLMAAVQALQNRHTRVSPPSRVIANQGTHENRAPFNKVFSQEVSDAAEYWISVYDKYQSENIQKRYEVLIVYDRGDYVIRDFNASWEESYGKDTIVTEINGTSIDEAIKTCYDSGYIDYDFKREKNYLWSITPWNFGVDALFTLRNSTGHEWEETFSTIPGSATMPYVYPSSLLNLTKYEDKSIAYIYIGDFGSKGQEYIDDMKDFYPQIEDYKYLIIDIRGNQGGFYSVWIDSIVSPLIKDKLLLEYYNAYRTGDYVTSLHGQWLTHEVSKDEFDYLPPEVHSEEYRIYKHWQTIQPGKDVGFNGEIIVLIDSLVYSASEGFAFTCRKYGIATFYGTPSGGDGLMIYPLYYVLPNSKLVVEFASSLGLDSTGHANEEVRTQPDVYFESAYGNHNELINYVIDDLEKRGH